MLIRVMTYNIHKGIGGVDRKYNPDRIVEAITTYDPDIVLMQEVDNGVARSRHDRQVDVLADALNYTFRAFQENVKLKVGWYGNAILSRFPIQSTQDIDLTIWPKKRRQALLAELSVPVSAAGPAIGHRSLIVANVHLGLAGYERRRQLRRLVETQSLLTEHPRTPAIIGGDFNDVWHNLANGHLELNQFQTAIGLPKTFPAALPMRCLDGIYFRGNLQVVRGFAGHCKVTRAASDHLPAIAEFKIN